MNVLLIGSGGREHALAWHLAQAEKCAALYCAPGNAGIEECAECVPIASDDIDGIVTFASEKAIDLVVIGPEAPLVAGLADKLRAAKIAVFGPSAAAARLEGSKAFMKDLCRKYEIPTAAYGRFTDPEQACTFIREQGAPIVVKADGLAAGKGVIIATTVEEAEQAAKEMLSGAAFGESGREIVIEEYLDGEELSFFALADGTHVVPFGSAQDHKRAFDGDKGPNTGGMGAYTPAHMMTQTLADEIMNIIIKPAIDAMAAEKCPFTGVLFAGIMMIDGKPVLLEFNTRFGDPECQALMFLFDGDLLDILDAAAKGRLKDVEDQIYWRQGVATCVVMAAQGYPAQYSQNTAIDLGEADFVAETKVFHAGTARDAAGKLVNQGGRVLGVTSLGATIEESRSRAYEAGGRISWPEGFYRKDIGWRAAGR